MLLVILSLLFMLYILLFCDMTVCCCVETLFVVVQIILSQCSTVHTSCTGVVLKISFPAFAISCWAQWYRTFPFESKKAIKYLWPIYRVLWRHHNKTVLEVNPADRREVREQRDRSVFCFAFSSTKWASSFSTSLSRCASRCVWLAASVPSGLQVCVPTWFF